MGLDCRWTGRTFAFCTLTLAFAVGANSGLAGGKRSDSEVKVSAKASKLDDAGRQTVMINLDINKGWHLYANPINNEQFTSLQTIVVVNAKTKPEVTVKYPVGKVHKDTVVGDYRVYENKVTIQAQVQRAAGDNGPLEVSVRFNACNDRGQCLPPANVKITVP